MPTADARCIPAPTSRNEAVIPQTSERDAGTLRVVELDLKTDKRYDRFVASHPQALIFHHSGWLSALEAEYRTGAVLIGCEDQEGCLHGVLPLLYTRGMPFNIGTQQTGRRLSSLPRTPLAGPLATSEAVRRLLLRAAADLARAESAQLQIKSTHCFPAAAGDGLLCTDWRPTYVLEIPERQEDLRFGDARTRHNIKWAVKKAERNGITVRFAGDESELLAWYPLYLQTMRRNVVPPRPLRLFVAMWRNLVSQGLMQLRLAEQKQGDHQRLVAGSIFLTFGDTTFYAFTGIDDNALSLHANDLVLWRTINDACGAGIRWFDLGEVSEDHPELTRFKTKWGARPREQYRYYSGDSIGRHGHSPKSRGAAMQFAAKVWRRLPLRVTQQLGDLIYSRL